MAKTELKVWGYRCERCGHEWVPRAMGTSATGEPRVCPKCKSAYWNVPRKSAKPSAKAKK